MGFLFEIVAQVVIELICEWLFRGFARVLRTAVGRSAVLALAGFGFGVGWGEHLAGAQEWPRLLWVSLALALVALLRAAARAGESPGAGVGQGGAWRAALAPPWRWGVERLVGFAVINIGLAVGIVVGFGWT